MQRNITQRKEILAEVVTRTDIVLSEMGQLKKAIAIGSHSSQKHEAVNSQKQTVEQ